MASRDRIGENPPQPLRDKALPSRQSRRCTRRYSQCTTALPAPGLRVGAPEIREAGAFRTADGAGTYGFIMPGFTLGEDDAVPQNGLRFGRLLDLVDLELLCQRGRR